MAFISSDQNDHLKFLVHQPQELLPEFCKMALEHIKEGPNNKKFEIAASNL